MDVELDPKKDPEQVVSHRIFNRTVFYSDHIIMEQGTDTNNAFYIESGEVEISLADGPHTLVIAKLGPGEIIGEMALLEHGVRSATVRAVTDTVVTQIPPEWLESKIDAHEGHVVRALLNVFVRRLREANKSQMTIYRNLAELQDRITGLAHKATDLHLDQKKREQFRSEAEPLLEALDKMLGKYKQQ